MGIKNKASSNLIGRIFKVISLIFITVGIGGLGFLLNDAYSTFAFYKTEFSDNISVDESTFIEADSQRLANYAKKVDQMIEQYNMPSNLTGDGWDYYTHCDTIFKRKPASYGVYNSTQFLEYCDPLDTDHILNEIEYYRLTGHSAVYSSFLSMGQAFRYAIAARENNHTEMNSARAHLLHVVKAYDFLSKLAPDGMLVRVAVPNTTVAKEILPDYLYRIGWDADHLYFHLNYTHDEKNYTFYCDTGTSVDVYMVYNALGIIYRMCNDTEIRTIARSAVDRMLEYHVKHGWRFIDYDGKTHVAGAEALTGSPLLDPMYALTFLRVGKTCHPERWTQLYDSYIYDRLFGKKIGKHSQLDVFSMFVWSGGYFNINLATTLAGTISFLEDDPIIKQYYRQHFLKPLHELTKYHRNAWFDVMYYLGAVDQINNNYQNIVDVPSDDLIEEKWRNYIPKSVGDALMRMTYTKYPFRKFQHPNGIETYETDPNLSPIQNAGYPEVNLYNWDNSLLKPSLGSTILTSLLSPDPLWDQPRPADWYSSKTWMWEQNPFRSFQVGDASDQLSMGGSYSSPYWIGRFLNFSTIHV